MTLFKKIKRLGRRLSGSTLVQAGEPKFNPQNPGLKRKKPEVVVVWRSDDNLRGRPGHPFCVKQSFCAVC